MDIPISMRDELGQWNGGKGIDLESWVGCEGSFSLAVGYTTVFLPEFEEIKGYVLHKGVPIDIIRGFENREGSSRLSVEATLNHIHLVDLQYHGCPDVSSDKLVTLGQVLKEIYEAKLKWQFPLRLCTTSLYILNDPNAYRDYEFTFWQTAHETSNV